jgi:APA family basic amino acid/polyamine antiporter
MIGSGIFIVSADITRNVGSAGWLIAVWVIPRIYDHYRSEYSYGDCSWSCIDEAGGQYVI